MAGQGAEVAGVVDELGKAADLGRRDRSPAQAGITGEKFRHDLDALLGLERAGAIDQHAAGADEFDRARQQPALQRRQRRDVRFRA